MTEAGCDIDKAERIAREALQQKMHGDLPSWFWPEGTLGLIEEIRELRAEVHRLRHLRAERDRYRSALLEIAEHSSANRSTQLAPSVILAESMARRASLALDGPADQR